MESNPVNDDMVRTEVLVTTAEDLEPAVLGVEEETIDGPSYLFQRENVAAGLRRLYDSLRGPEQLLDKGNYSRPFPPPVRRRSNPQGGR